MNALSPRSLQWMQTQFGYHLGLTASHSDILDYRAMLARFRVGGLPAANVRYELLNDEPLRALDERYRAAAYGEKYGRA